MIMFCKVLQSQYVQCRADIGAELWTLRHVGQEGTAPGKRQRNVHRIFIGTPQLHVSLSKVFHPAGNDSDVLVELDNVL